MIAYYILLYVFGPLAVLDLVLRLSSLRARRKNSEAAKLGWARRRAKVVCGRFYQPPPSGNLGIWKE